MNRQRDSDNLGDLGSSRKVYRFDAGRWTELPLPQQAADLVQFAPTGQVWAESYRSDALQQWDGKRWTRHHSQAPIREIALYGNEVWTLTAKGVERFDGTSWQTWPNAPNKGVVEAMAAGPSGVWVVTEDAHLSHFDGDTWTSEDLKSTPAGKNWDKIVDGGGPQIRVTSDGAVWFVLNGLWRRDSEGWRSISVPKVDWEDATSPAQSGESIWIQDADSVFEVSPDGSVNSRFEFSRLPLKKDSYVMGVAVDAGKVWLATTSDLMMFDGREWRNYALPSGKTMLMSVAASQPASGGGVWVLAERVPQVPWMFGWVSQPLLTSFLVQLIFGVSIALWAQSFTAWKLRADREVVRAAGAIPGIDFAKWEAEYRRQVRSLWWKAPAALTLFTVYQAVKETAPMLFPVARGLAIAPFAVIAAFLFVQCLRRRAKLVPRFASRLWFLYWLLFCNFLLGQLWPGQAALSSNAWGYGLFFMAWFCLFGRNVLAGFLIDEPMKQGRYDDALRRLKWLNPVPNAQLAFLRATTLGNAGRNEEAEQCYRAALFLPGGGSARFRVSVLCPLGYTLTDLGRYDEARRCLESVVQIGDPGGNARLGLADLLLRQGKEPEKALGLAEESIRLDSRRPGLAERVGNKAWALALMGRTREMDESVAAALRSVSARNPAVFASVHWRIGRALAAVERTSQAVEHFRTAYEADPHGQHGQIALRDLQQYVTSEPEKSGHRERLILEDPVQDFAGLAAGGSEGRV